MFPLAIPDEELIQCIDLKTIVWNMTLSSVDVFLLHTYEKR